MKQSKMNIPKWLLLCASVSIINQAAIVDADYLVSVRIHNYSNPTNQCPTCSAENNHCCDIQRPSGVCDECNTFFQYCIQMFGGGSKECRDSHQYVDPGRTTLDFSQEFLLLQPNPLVFRGAGAWAGAHINLTVFDRDLNEPQNDLLNEVQVNLTIKDIQLGVETLPKTYTGPTGYSNITLSFYVTCAENWYGPYCNIFSQDFTCDLPVLCHDNCMGVVCGENRHCVDGVDVYVCTCDNGFTGRDCDININDCEGVNCSGNGRCIDRISSFQCECDSGYSGVLCEIANEGLPRCSITSSFLGNIDTLYILVPGVIGWALIIFLVLTIPAVLICIGLKRRASSTNIQLKTKSPQQQSSAPPILMNRNQAFSATENTSLSISNQQLHKNVSYQVGVLDQSVIPSTTAAESDYEDDENSLISNQAYERNGESHYEDIV